jgi:predicted transcriptional regulator|tara:strand:+ start:3065 stop:3328 length:264 start_codon:yes stop_codon:yes gene_type:complete
MMAMTPEHPEDATLGDIIFRLRDDLDKALARISELEERVRATHVELAMHKFCIVALQEITGHPLIKAPIKERQHEAARKPDTDRGDF